MKDISIAGLAGTALFTGMEADEIPGLLQCLDAKLRVYAKNDHILEEGDMATDVGIILTGHGRAVKWDASGKIILLSMLEEGCEIGMMIAAGDGQKSPVTVQALEEMTVLSIPFSKVLSRCAKACHRHDILLRNYIHILAQKGLMLHQRIDCLLRPTVREKVMSYLERVSAQQHSRRVSLPINRNAMAEYLNVERSALSRELSRMKRDGLIDYHRNHFQLL